jgi:hypothetical protein
MSRRNRKKKITLDRATPVSMPGGALMYVPQGYAQSTYGQTFYGSQTKNTPTGQVALFSPGQPLLPQSGINPGGLPVQWKFAPASNSFPVDRTSQNPEVPSFQQLRSLAKLYNGITLCERAWLDLVPRMKLKIELKPEYIAAGADPKDYQAEISYFMSWFESPDKQHDLHSWIRMALREQTQIDELYIYKRKKRGGGLYAMELVAGDQIKPLLDDWGKIPQPPSYAYQQYPWGIPGAWFRSDELIHYQESPAADNPYGQSRIERIIMLVNQALRKQKKDLSHFTEGNIPQGMMLVPENATWTPDQIDAFEQAWNALLAGNATQQVRMRFTQPGMTYQPFEQYTLDPTFDKFILNIAVSSYGMSMQDVAFTEDIHKSSGDSQQNVLYRRTIDPLAVIYAGFITQAINTDFDPDLQGEMFQASFGGYEEAEDITALAGAYVSLVGSGIVGVTNAGKILNLPDDPNAPYIGRILVTQSGPIFLDDMASDKMRNAQMQSQLAGYQQAAQPQQAPAKPDAQGNGEEEQSKGKEQQGKTSSSADTNDDTEQQNEASTTSTTPTQPEEEDQPTPEDMQQEDEINQHLKSDSDEPFTTLERHVPGGHDHDQKTHGDHAHPAYGAKHDKTPGDKQAMQLAAAQLKVIQARAALKAASPDDKPAARAALKKAEANLHSVHQQIATQKKQAAQQAHTAKQAAAEKSKEQKAEVKEEKTDAKQHTAQEKAQAAKEKAGDKAKLQQEKAHAQAEKQKADVAKKTAEARAKAEAQKARLQKQAAAAQAKTARMAAQAGAKAQAAAAKAAKTQAKSARSTQQQQLKAAKQQQAAAKTLQSLTKTIGAKASLYNALSGRKISKTWTAADATDAQNIATDLHSLMEAVNSHENEGDANALLNHLTASIDKLAASKGITSARAGVLSKLTSRAQQQMSRMVGIDEDDEEIMASFDEVWTDFEEDDADYDEEAWFDDGEDEDTGADVEEPRYTIGELLQLLTQQRQTQTPDQAHGADIARSEEGAMAPTAVASPPTTSDRERYLDLKRWQKRAVEDVERQRAYRGFTTLYIAAREHQCISEALERCATPDDVRELFRVAQDGVILHWQDGNREAIQRIEALKVSGVTRVTWRAHQGCCEECAANEGQTCVIGEQRFPTGAWIVPQHVNCVCTMQESKI